VHVDAHRAQLVVDGLEHVENGRNVRRALHEEHGQVGRLVQVARRAQDEELEGVDEPAEERGGPILRQLRKWPGST
jgi:hypothetical protein